MMKDESDMIATMNEPVIRLTRAQVREIDRRAIHDFHIPGIVLMENAARGAVDVAEELLQHFTSVIPKIAVLCGGGNNGGDGLAVARHLQNHGHDVWIALFTDPQKYQGDAAINWGIIQSMQFHCVTADDPNLESLIQNSNLIIDALFGTGLQTAPHKPTQIDMINELAKTILAIDLPSGLDCDTGQPPGPACIRATRTVTFVAEKAGFANPTSQQYTGPVTVADIGCPRFLIAQVLHDIRG
jgi:NAD(P)H-hydrate epimerase